MSDDPAGRILSAIEALRTDLTVRIDRFEQRIDHLEQGQTRLRTDIMDRIDRLQNAVTAIQDDIGVNMGRSDAVARAGQNTRDELRALNEVVAGMGRQIHRLQAEVRALRGGI